MERKRMSKVHRYNILKSVFLILLVDSICYDRPWHTMQTDWGGRNRYWRRNLQSNVLAQVINRNENMQLTSETGESVFIGLSEISLVNTVDGAYAEPELLEPA